MTQKDSEILKGRIRDTVKLCDKNNSPKFLGFLDSNGAAIAQNIARQESAKFMLYGGYDSAERLYFGAFPDWCDSKEELFPIVKLKITNKSDKKLSHRDFLGALMALGLERDVLGDILVSYPETIVFVARSVADYIITTVDKIGSSGVEISIDEADTLHFCNTFSEHSGTVASPRLDCVVAELIKGSRGKAVSVIEEGLVAVGGVAVTKVTRNVVEGDIISIRRVGKFVIDGITDVTRKNRIALKYRKYV